MANKALSILVFSSSILISITLLTLSVDCDSFASDIISDKCKSDMSTNLIFVIVIMTPFIGGSAYYLFPVKEKIEN